jgi:hypothetical protein
MADITLDGSVSLSYSIEGTVGGTSISTGGSY